MPANQLVELPPIAERLTFSAAAQKIGVHVATLWRWATAGCRGVRLQSWSIGARRFTTATAIDQFMIDTTAAATGEPLPVRTPRQRTVAIAKARQQLEAAGVR